MLMAHICQVLVQIFNKVQREFYFKSFVAAESRAVLYLWLKSVAECNCPHGVLLQNSFYFEDGRITMEKEITLSEFADELTGASETRRHFESKTPGRKDPRYLEGRLKESDDFMVWDPTEGE
jgi:hypothetical protein